MVQRWNLQLKHAKLLHQKDPQLKFTKNQTFLWGETETQQMNQTWLTPNSKKKSKFKSKSTTHSLYKSQNLKKKMNQSKFKLKHSLLSRKSNLKNQQSFCMEMLVQNPLLTHLPLNKKKSRNQLRSNPTFKLKKLRLLQKIKPTKNLNKKLKLLEEKMTKNHLSHTLLSPNQRDPSRTKMPRVTSQRPVSKVQRVTARKEWRKQSRSKRLPSNMRLRDLSL